VALEACRGCSEMISTERFGARVVRRRAAYGDGSTAVENSLAGDARPYSWLPVIAFV
jgi:hypothetical protein